MLHVAKEKAKNDENWCTFLQDVHALCIVALPEEIVAHGQRQRHHAPCKVAPFVLAQHAKDGRVLQHVFGQKRNHLITKGSG